MSVCFVISIFLRKQNSLFLTRNYKIFTSFYRTNKPFCTIAVIFGIYIDTSHSVLFHFMPHLELV